MGDLRSGYHEVRIKHEYVHETTSRIRYGHYEFVVVPFGPTDAPTTFMCLMNIVFSRYLDKFVLAFLGDILTYSKNEEENEGHLRLTLKFPKENKLYGRLRKCDFYKVRIIIWVTLSQVKEYLQTLKRLRPL